jgi:RNA polymerase sigma-70 factor (ECF subfamily)
MHSDDTSISFDSIVSALKPELSAYLYRLTSAPAETEDILQETLIKIQKGLSQLEARANVRAWAFKIATNAAMDFFRKQRPYHEIGDDELLLDPNANETDDDDALVIEEMNTCIRDMVHTLPLEYRIPTALFRLADRSIAEIADIMGISQESVKVRIHRGKKQLTQTLSNGCHFYTTGNGVLRCEKK